MERKRKRWKRKRQRRKRKRKILRKRIWRIWAADAEEEKDADAEKVEEKVEKEKESTLDKWVGKVTVEKESLVEKVKDLCASNVERHIRTPEKGKEKERVFGAFMENMRIEWNEKWQNRNNNEGQQQQQQAPQASSS